MKMELLIIKLKLDNPGQVTNYAFVPKTALFDQDVNLNEEVCNMNKLFSTQDSNKISIITGKQKFRGTVEIKRTFAKVFALKIIVSVFTTARGNTHLEFPTVEAADKVLKYWNPEIFGGDP